MSEFVRQGLIVDGDLRLKACGEVVDPRLMLNIPEKPKLLILTKSIRFVQVSREKSSNST